MDPSVRRVGPHLAGLFLASVGFFLSVLSVFFNILLSKAPLVEHDDRSAHAVPLGRDARVVHIPVETPPKNPSTPLPKSPPTTPPVRESVQNPPVPLPTPHAGATLSPKLERNPGSITFVRGTDADSMSSPRKAHSMPSVRVLVHPPCEGPNNHTFLSQLNPLRDKHPKPNRCNTSPPLASPHLEANPLLPTPNQTKPPEPQAVKEKNSGSFRKDSLPSTRE